MGLLTGSALFSTFLSNVHLSSATVSSAVLELLHETREKVVVLLLAVSQTALNSGTSSPEAAVVVRSALHMAHSIGQMAMFLYCCQGDGPEWSVPLSDVIELVIPVQAANVGESSLCLPRLWSSSDQPGYALLSSPGIQLLLVSQLSPCAHSFSAAW